jgi:hypothetical protein
MKINRKSTRDFSIGMYIYIQTFLENYQEVKKLKKYLKLLRQNISKVQQVWEGNRKDTFLDAYILLSNKILIDLESTFMLLNKGYYGSCYSLCASMVRANKMLTALQADPTIRTKYLDEDKNTYQTDTGFKKDFSEKALAKKINDKFGIGASFRNEMDKTLHGSAFGNRKYYCKIYINEKGQRVPFMPFGPIYEYLKATGIIGMMQGICLDNIGIFLEEYKNRKEFSNIKKRYFEYLIKLGIVNPNFNNRPLA